MIRARRRSAAWSCPVHALEGRVLFAVGELDPTFGGHDGFVSTDVYPYVNADFSRDDAKLGMGVESIYDVAVLPDGRLLAVGGGNSSFVAVRYNPDGSLDKTFGGGDGIAEIALQNNASDTAAHAVALLPDGRFLRAVRALQHAFTLVRCNSDGSIDPTFGGGGLDGDGATGVAFSDLIDTATEIAVLPSGKILIAGTTNVRPAQDAHLGSNSDVGLVQFNADGTLDTTFGIGGPDGDGVVTIDVGTNDGANALRVLPDGKILVAGSMTPGSNTTAFGVARLNFDGTLDPTFSPGGAEGSGVAVAADAATGTTSSAAQSISLLDDGTIVLAGTGTLVVGQGRGGNDYSWYFVVAHFRSDGSVDTSFGGGDGAAQTETTGPIGDVVALPGGKFVAAAQTRASRPRN